MIRYRCYKCIFGKKPLFLHFILQILVRGRAFDESKPETFNQLWTVEEQRRLEELLVEYPPEEVEMRRWTKIANALGIKLVLRLYKPSSVSAYSCKN